VVTAEPVPPVAQPVITADPKPPEPVAAAAAPPAEPPAAAIPEVPVSSDASGVYLQLGAFSQRDNAELFRARIYRQLGWLTDTIQIKSGDGLYRLHLGPYRDRAEAERVAVHIRETLELKPAVVIK
jgi:rare lipoprotein A